MSLTKYKWKDYKFEDYKSKYLLNKEVEWLLEHGKIRETVYFKGAIGDRYSIYVANKRNKNIVDFHRIDNTYSYGTTFAGNVIATLDSNYILTMKESGAAWYRGTGYTLKQLARQGVMSNKENYDIRWCRTAYMIRFKKFKGTVIEEVSPWVGMKIDLKNGRLFNKPNKSARIMYKDAKRIDKDARKANYLSNKNNAEALRRYVKAGGDTTAARARWTNNGQNVNQAALDPSLATMDWDLIPMDDCFKHRNATLRSNIIEHYGMNAIIATLKYDIVDEDTIDGRKYRLLDVVIPDMSVVMINNTVETTHKGLYLEMINPSTGESHFEGVANVGNWNGLNEATVKEALKWRDGDSDITKDNSYDTVGSLDYIEPVTLT